MPTRSCSDCTRRSAPRRASFARNREKTARARGLDLSKKFEFWLRRKYNLLPTDPRFLALTKVEIETEYWAHYYADNPGKEHDEDPDFDADAIEAAMEDDDAWEELTGGQ